jgi:uncharacterized RDD family membrane protein YckC
VTVRAAPTARAGLVSRGVAFAIDLVILALIAHGISQLGYLLRDALPHAGPRLHISAIVVAITPLIFAVYHVGSWLLWGATPAQWLFGLRVVSTRGGALRPLQACARVLAYVLSALPFYAGFLWVVLPGRRTWHDLLVGTAVVYRQSHPKVIAGQASAVR